MPRVAGEYAIGEDAFVIERPPPASNPSRYKHVLHLPQLRHGRYDGCERLSIGLLSFVWFSEKVVWDNPVPSRLAEIVDASRLH